MFLGEAIEALSSRACARNSLRAVECGSESVFLAQLFLASDLDSHGQTLRYVQDIVEIAAVAHVFCLRYVQDIVEIAAIAHVC